MNNLAALMSEGLTDNLILWPCLLVLGFLSTPALLKLAELLGACEIQYKIEHGPDGQRRWTQRKG